MGNKYISLFKELIFFWIQNFPLHYYSVASYVAIAATAGVFYYAIAFSFRRRVV